MPFDGVFKAFKGAPNDTLQHTATHCNTLQHTVTHCNTLQHTVSLRHSKARQMTHCNRLKALLRVCQGSFACDGMPFNVVFKGFKGTPKAIWNGVFKGFKGMPKDTLQHTAAHFGRIYSFL